MAGDSGQNFIKRNRAPRVHISYQDPYDADEKVELPFVMGVMSDLSGNAPGQEKAEVADRTFLEFDMDNFDKRMGAIQPGAKMTVANKLGGDGDDKLNVDLKFNTMEDFSPGAVAKQVPATAELLKAREQLKNLRSYMDGKAAANQQLKTLLNDPKLMAALREQQARGSAEGGGED